MLGWALLFLIDAVGRACSAGGIAGASAGDRTDHLLHSSRAAGRFAHRSGYAGKQRSTLAQAKRPRAAASSNGSAACANRAARRRLYGA